MTQLAGRRLHTLRDLDETGARALLMRVLEAEGIEARANPQRSHAPMSAFDVILSRSRCRLLLQPGLFGQWRLELQHPPFWRPGHSLETLHALQRLRTAFARECAGAAVELA